MLFWEETEETCYRLQRVLTHFENAGVWEQIAGMVIGKLDQIDIEVAPGEGSVERMLQAHFAPYDFPILKTEFFGHNTPVNLTLPIGGAIEVTSEQILIS